MRLSFQKQRGFTLIEMLVATLIMLIGLVAAAQLVPFAIQLNTANRYDSTALVIAQRQMEVAINDTHLRAKPTTHSDRLATLKRGTKVDVIEMVEHGKWAHVKVLGKMGYISANLLR